MAHDLSREDLKRNELGEAVEAGVHYAEGHVRTILGALGAVAAVALLIWGVFTWRTGRADAASEQLGRAVAVAGAEIVTSGAQPDDVAKPTFASEAERDARARQLFEALAREHGSSGAGQAANLWLAEKALVGGDRATARTHWKSVLDAEDRGAFAAVARVGLARIDREEGNAAGLLAELQAELAAGSGPLPVDALLAELALTQEKLGQTAEATATWRRLVDEHPDSPYAGQARTQLAPDGGGAA
jgi:hypothetical protein